MQYTACCSVLHAVKRKRRAKANPASRSLVRRSLSFRPARSFVARLSPVSRRVPPISTATPWVERADPREQTRPSGSFPSPCLLVPACLLVLDPPSLPCARPVSQPVIPHDREMPSSHVPHSSSDGPPFAAQEKLSLTSSNRRLAALDRLYYVLPPGPWGDMAHRMRPATRSHFLPFSHFQRWLECHGQQPSACMLRT